MAPILLEEQLQEAGRGGRQAGEVWPRFDQHVPEVIDVDMSLVLGIEGTECNSGVELSAACQLLLGNLYLSV